MGSGTRISCDLRTKVSFSEFRMRFQLWNVIQESRLFGLLGLYLLDWSKEKQKFVSRTFQIQDRPTTLISRLLIVTITLMNHGSDL